MIKITRPAFVVDKEICLRNIEKMANKARENNLRFRPHFKTHQSAQIGNWFRDFGVESITVSSVIMAEYFSANGWKDITIAFPVNILEIENINRLADSICLNVLIENSEAASVLAQKIKYPLGVYLKIDTGYNRTGIDFSATSTIEKLIDILSKNKNLTFKGFLSHTGNTYQARSTDEIHQHHTDALFKMNSLKQRYKPDFPFVEISLGDTPSCSICNNFEGLDEIRPGNFIFYDAMMENLGVCNFSDIAVKLVCPVVALHFSRNEIVIYGGAVHLSKESVIDQNGKRIFGRIALYNNIKSHILGPLNYVSSLSQEHGILKVETAQFKNFRFGDLVEIIPVHSCLTANLARNYFTSEGETIRTLNS